jgi:hypothetical protein
MHAIAQSVAMLAIVSLSLRIGRTGINRSIHKIGLVSI